MPDKKVVNDLVTKLKATVEAQKKVMSAAKQTSMELEADAERPFQVLPTR